MNRKQKAVIIIAGLLITAVIIIWLTQGSEVFTKTEILIDNTSELDRLLGIVNKQYVGHFVLGLLPSGYLMVSELVSVITIAGFVLLVAGIFLFIFRNRKGKV